MRTAPTTTLSRDACTRKNIGVTCPARCGVVSLGDPTGDAGASSAPQEQARHAMASTTRTIEGVPLDTRSGLHCPRCSDWTLVETDVAIVDAASLELLRTVTGSTCLACGASD